MTSVELILKNVLRQRARTALTVLGISLGITTVVALGVIVDGLQATSGEVIRAGGADFMVGQKGASDLTFSTITEQEWEGIAALPGIEQATGAVIYVTRVGGNPFFVTIGVRPDQLATLPLNVVSGNRLSSNASDEIMLGIRAASDLDATIGATVSIAGGSFRVVGIYQTGNVWQDNGAYGPLSVIQEMAGRQGVVTMVYVSASPGVDPSAVARSVEEHFPELTAIEDVSDYGEVDQGMRMIDAANLAISLLAVGIGAIGVTNTMVMSVFERTREIGILRAVGWRGSRIVRLILGESLVLCMVAAVVGTLAGVLATQGILHLEAISGLLEPKYSLSVFLRGLVVAIAVALAGAAYPAVRAVRLTPMEALRHE